MFDPPIPSLDRGNGNKCGAYVAPLGKLGVGDSLLLLFPSSFMAVSVGGWLRLLFFLGLALPPPRLFGVLAPRFLHLSSFCFPAPTTL